MAANDSRPRPLNSWISGIARFHFKSGHVAEVRVHRDIADHLRRILEGMEGDDRVALSAPGFLHIDSGEVVLLEWHADPEYGWPPMPPEERRALKAAGYPRGILPRLADLNESNGRPDASYSTEALVFLHHAACQGYPDREWDDLATALEGETATSKLFQRLLNEVWPQSDSQSAAAAGDAKFDAQDSAPANDGTDTVQRKGTDEGVEADGPQGAGQVDDDSAPPKPHS